MDKKKILIVDDEMDTRLVLEKGLCAEGYSVITTSMGSDVIDLARLKRPDLIILDLKMPDMYGGDIARMLKDDPETKTIPVMFLTGMFPKEEERKSGRIVAGHVLFEKPYDMEELLTAIEELLSVSGCKSINHKNSQGDRLMDTKISVLVIEDEKDVRKVLECRLKSDGLDVYLAADGPTGLKIAAEKKPDVILLDWIMPKMNGLEVLSELRRDERTKDIIVFMLTAKNMIDDMSTAFANGADDYIPKPFDGAELGQRIISMLGAVKKIKRDRACENAKALSL